MSKGNPYKNNKNSATNNTLKILVPILIFVAVAAIGLLKHFDLSPTDFFKVENGERVASQKLRKAKSKKNEADPSSSAEEEGSDFNYEVIKHLDIEKLKTYNLPIIIEFGADWCPPCQHMEPIMRGLNEELQGKAIIRYVDTDKIRVTDYNFQAIPTQLFINADGTPYAPTKKSPVQMDMFTNKNTSEHIYTLHTGILSREDVLTILKEMGMK